MSEKERIELLVRRDGLEEARAWVKRTLKLYRESIASDASHASMKEYRPRFEQSIRDFEEWLKGNELPEDASDAGPPPAGRPAAH